MSAKSARKLVHFNGSCDVQSDVVEDTAALAVAGHRRVNRVNNKLVVAQRVRGEEDRMVVSVDPLETDNLFPELALFLENSPRHVKTDVAESRERRHGVISFPVNQTPYYFKAGEMSTSALNAAQVDMTMGY
jgi:hypothetical protein